MRLVCWDGNAMKAVIVKKLVDMFVDDSSEFFVMFLILSYNN